MAERETEKPASTNGEPAGAQGIDIELLDDVLFVDRPASAAARQVVDLFRVDPDGERATRVQVRMGRASVRSIEIVEGLAEGDRIVISDTRRWDEHDRLRFK